MHKNNRLTLLTLALGSITASAQQSAVYVDRLADYNHAVALYNEEQYLAAQLLFSKVKQAHVGENTEVESDCAYYIAHCAIRLNQDGAEDKIDAFVKKYPTSSKQNQAYVEVTDYYFSKGDFPKALKYAVKVKENAITNEKKLDRFNFEKGYSYFYTKNKKEAERYLKKVNVRGEWGEQATYYLGYIAYDSDKFDEAKQLFNKVETKSSYQEKMGYYQADMSFKTGNFQTAIDQGVDQLGKATPQEKSELSKIIGESYFNLKQYDKALPHLLAYQGKGGKWSNTDFYQLGYTYYKSKDYPKAIEQFNKIIGGDNAIAQNAYYHLGESYLQTHKKTQALNAFKNASEMRFDAGIQEDAFLNYAKLSYDIGNAYESTPSVLNSYISKYPNSAYKAEIEGLLIDSYVSSRNYKEALVLLEKSRSVGNKEVYQQVTLLRGQELFNEGDFKGALGLFDKSLTEKQNLKYTAKAQYWKGETLFYLNDFKESIAQFNAFEQNTSSKGLSERDNLYYALAYSYFKQKDYTKAGEYFKQYTDGTPKDESRRLDAFLRLGDCNFVTGKYWPAMEAYNKVIEANKVDVEYARFQKAVSYGFVDRNPRKIEDLTQFVKDFPKSNLADDAQYEIGVTYDVMNQDQKALVAFDKLLKDYPTSSYKPRAVLRQGLINYNANKPNEALVKFKQVVKESPDSSEALEAVQNARLIYVDNGKVDEYAAWVKGLSFIQVTDAELDKDTYESAEKQYIQNNTKTAIEGYEKYLKSFPTGQKALQAHFYLGQMYFAENNMDKAVVNYEAVVSRDKNEFSEISLARLAEIYLKNKNTSKAISTLKRLDTEAVQEQNVVFAKSNLMKLYYEQNSYAEALTYAEAVLKMPKTDNKVKSDAQVVIARTAMATNEESKAKKAYQEVLKIAKGELAAEALYYDAYFKNKEGKYDASNETVQKIAKEYSGYKYYGAKGLVLMAKNFYQLKDSYQATYILESVTNNFTDYPDVVSEAKKELQTIKNQEAKRNSSIAQ
ncbi:tetratricopeptide repeat protein [Myroides sp. M-43]|uniref:tetratricopeptide repeat protein n=1 Tax=Myroides oncorhynchi TaxID=2893756 RepID=UPI001E5C2E02|nr:tetratricopeptide repeat protein [Myroides oncorhynchi]MCC9043335.1 tetratricopeptide repeat protein [Myroides oncorhynchi]